MDMYKLLCQLGNEVIVCVTGVIKCNGRLLGVLKFQGPLPCLKIQGPLIAMLKNLMA